MKEIDIAATLEHVRDQRPGMVQTKVFVMLSFLTMIALRNPVVDKPEVRV